MVALRGPQSEVTGIKELSNDRIVVSHKNGTLKLWDLHSSSCVHESQEPSGSIVALEVNPKRSELITLSASGDVRFWRWANDEITCEPVAFRDVRAMAVSPNSQRLSIVQQNRIQCYSLVDRQKVAEEPVTDDVSIIASSPSGKLLATGTDDGRARVWNANDLTEPLATIERGKSLYRLLFSPDEATLAMAGSGIPFLWSWMSDEYPIRLHGHRNESHAIAYSTGGDVVVTGSHDLTVQVWDSRNGKHRFTYCGHTRYVSQVEVRDERCVWSGDRDGVVQAWDPVHPQGRQVQSTGDSNHVAFRFLGKSQTHRMLGGLNESDQYLSWETPDDQLDSEIGFIYSMGVGRKILAVSHDERLIAFSAFDGHHLLIADLVADKVLHRSNRVETILMDGAFSPDASWLAVADEESITMIDTSSGREMGAIPGVKQIVVSPDGMRLATVSESDHSDVDVFDVMTKTRLATLRRHRKFVTSCCFSPNGLYFATVGEDGIARIWETATWNETRALRHSSQLADVEFDRTSSILTTSNSVGEISFWDVVTGEIIYAVSTDSVSTSSVVFSDDNRCLAITINATGDKRAQIELLRAVPSMRSSR
ncbi:WD40 repeat domain-containing protein [Planctomycetota bacterium]